MEENAISTEVQQGVMHQPIAGNLSIEQVKWTAEMFFKSGLFNDTQDYAKSIVKVMAGAELGFTPFQAMKSIQIIKGNIMMSGNSIASRVKEHKRYDYKINKSDVSTCIIDWYEIDPESKKFEKIGTNAFTIQMADAAGLTHKDVWRKYPKAMLFNRAISDGYKSYAPDIFNVPIYTPDEIDEIKPDPTEFVPSDDQIAALRAPKAAELPAETETPSAPPVETPEGEQEVSNHGVDVNPEFKTEVTAQLDELGLKAQDRMRLIKKATGSITLKDLDDHQWRALDSAIADALILNADNESEAETTAPPEEPTEILKPKTKVKKGDSGKDSESDD